MKQKKIPERKCIACQKHFPKKELFRIVKTKDEEIFYDPTGKANGRGYYICGTEACVNKACKHHLLGHVLDEEVVEAIIKAYQARQKEEPPVE